MPALPIPHDLATAPPPDPPVSGTGRWSRPPLAVLLGVLTGALLLAACSSSPASPSAASGTTTSNAATAATCQQVGAALSDGPDPDADPVGYALAQVRPLQAIHTTDADLKRDIDALADAYQDVAAAHVETAAARSAVNRAGRALDGLCPGVTQ